MRTLITFAALAGILLTAAVSRGGEFIAGFEDIPVMPGMAVDGDASTAFDTRTGRIVEAYAAGDITDAAMRQFYQETLPQLGWARIGKLAFQREGEMLTLEVIDQGTPLTVRFRLSPSPK